MRESIEKKLQARAQQIVELQRQLGYSTARMIREYPDLGSDKTYKALAEGRMAEYDCETWLSRYEAVWALIEDAREAAGEATEEIYDDLSGPRHVRRAMLDLLDRGGNARVLVIEGASGIGKTTALNFLHTRYGSRIVGIEAAEAWSDSPAALLKSLLRSLGVVLAPAAAFACLAQATEALQKRRTCVVIDEAHHLGPRCLNTVKTLVNTTPGEFVLSAIETLWRRLEKANYEEARQLTTNRLAERVSLALTEQDIARYIERSIKGVDKPIVRAGARIIAQDAARNGNFAFVRDVCREVRRLVGEGKVEAQHFAEGVAAALRRR